MREDKIEVDCAKCDNDRIKHTASVLKRNESTDKDIIEFQCDDCNSIGILTVFKTSGIEIINYL